MAKKICCWWCCHTTTSKLLNMPIQYDEHLDLFQCKGYFCSFECMKTYNIYENDALVSKRQNLISLLMIKNKIEEVKFAPPRETLKMFGGNLSISEFRKQFKNNQFLIMKSNNINIVDNIVEKYNYFKWIQTDGQKQVEDVSNNDEDYTITKSSLNPIKIDDSDNNTHTLESVLDMFKNTT